MLNHFLECFVNDYCCATVTLKSTRIILETYHHKFKRFRHRKASMKRRKKEEGKAE